MGASPEKSLGARVERKAWRAKVQRLIRREREPSRALQVLLALKAFGTGRVKRYEAKAGGLGRT